MTCDCESNLKIIQENKKASIPKKEVVQDLEWALEKASENCDHEPTRKLIRDLQDKYRFKKEIGK